MKVYMFILLLEISVHTDHVFFDKSNRYSIAFHMCMDKLSE